MQSRFTNFAKNYLTKLFGSADVELNGNRPWDITVHEPRFYSRVMRGGSLALGESYMDQWWDCRRLDQLFFHLLRSRITARAVVMAPQLLKNTAARAINRQSTRRAFTIGERHYDMGNDLFGAMLDESMSYSCGYWAAADTLAEAQRAKLDMVCRKLQLQPGMRLLDIGCGWGGLVNHAAHHYGVKAVGITVSRQQQDVALKRCAGLPVSILLQDYRSVTGSFEAIASIGMFEHVGFRNYRSFMNIVHQRLAPDGLFLLHTIGANVSTPAGDPWFDKYIFPGGMLPSIKQIGAALERLFVMEDWHNFGVDYTRTLQCWHENFESQWDTLRPTYGDTFYRMWRYYLLAMMGSFQARVNQLWQIVLSPRGRIEGYRSIR
jgi:cyclopropane-fatty-acyl-phospholipid synthase